MKIQKLYICGYYYYLVMRWIHTHTIHGKKIIDYNNKKEYNNVWIWILITTIIIMCINKNMYKAYVGKICD